ncbi:MAG TPA: ClpX C4-type zinc finger protein [Blastocatellia bacterium]|nr:ClpX C4-type zinc finger protein [Blastocatellia bacterium]
MNRRRFIALIGAAVPGLWLDGTGLIQLPKRMVIALSGRCSFCAKDAREVFGLAGTLNQSTRVCNECIDICLQILRDDAIFNPASIPPPPPPPIAGHHTRRETSDAFDFEPIGVRRNAGAPLSSAELESLFEVMRKLLDQTEPIRKRRDDELSCSFCDRKKDEAVKLIAGPHVYICDVCIGDAAALISIHSLRR